MASFVLEHENQELGPDDSDGMALALHQDDLDGFEGEHVFDAGVEHPPHPFWDPVTMRCKPGAGGHYE